MIITIQVKAPMGHAIGVKEAIAMDLEKYGDVRVLEVRPEKETGAEQIQMNMEG